MERTVISSNRQAAYKKDYQEGLNFGYNFLNLVSDVWHNDTVKVCYQYLADGTKWSIRDASGNNGYDYDGSFVYKVQNGQPVFEKATALDVQFCNGKVLYALTDQLGSTRVLIDAQGEVVQQNDFYPFGAKALKSGYADNDNRFLFSGKEQQNMLDVNTYDFGARMYDAAIARWTCVDPMGEKMINLTLYNYCMNNPMAYIDRDGKFSERWAAEAVRSIYQIFFGDNVGPVIENKDATSDEYRYTFNILSFQNGEFTVTSYHEVDTYIAEMIQNAGDAISVAGYALTLSVIGAKFGVPIAVFGRTLSGIGAGLEFGMELLNGNYRNVIKIGIFKLLGSSKDRALKKVLPAYDKKYREEGFDLGTNILRQGGDIKLMIIETTVDMETNKRDKEKIMEKNNNLQNNRQR